MLYRVSDLPTTVRTACARVAARARYVSIEHDAIRAYAAKLPPAPDPPPAPDHGGRFLGVVEAAEGSAVALAGILAGWDCFADVSSYDGFEVPFYLRAQITAADLATAAWSAGATANG